MTRTSAALGLTYVLLVGCGGGSGYGDGGYGDGGKPSLSCNVSCMTAAATLMQGCVPEGACVQQQSTSSQAVCYANGVKMSMAMGSMSSSGGSITMTVKKNGSTCYSMLETIAQVDTPNRSITIVVKNAAGATVMTMSMVGETDPTVTCPGGAPSTINAACEAESSSVGNTSFGSPEECTEGSCVP